MKSRKLFAILTLVAFMMTLVPTLAFGGEEPAEASYDVSASRITKVKESLKVGKTAEVTVQFREITAEGLVSLEESSPVGSLWIRASRDGITIEVDEKLEGVDGIYNCSNLR